MKRLLATLLLFVLALAPQPSLAQDQCRMQSLPQCAVEQNCRTFVGMGTVMKHFEMTYLLFALNGMIGTPIAKVLPSLSCLFRPWCV